MRASVHVRRASSERDFGLLQEMVHQLLTPDVVSFSASINGCEKGKQRRAGAFALRGPHFRPTAPAAPAPRELLVAGTQHP